MLRGVDTLFEVEPLVLELELVSMLLLELERELLGMLLVVELEPLLEL